MKRMKLAALFAAVATTTALPTAATAGIVWTETGPDGAGDLLPTAQTVYDSAFNTLDEIRGSLSSTVPVGTDPSSPIFQVDLYKIRINNFATFSAKTISSESTDDTALYLFDSAGFGVYMNDDSAADDFLSTLPAGDVNSPASDGIYYLAVALGGFIANDSDGASVFDAGVLFTDVLGGSGNGPLATWAPGFTSLQEPFFAYDIELTGATNGDLPEPGSLALLMAGGIGAWLARRRSSVAPRPSVAAA
jgi:hypothetical protein